MSDTTAKREIAGITARREAAGIRLASCSEHLSGHGGSAEFLVARCTLGARLQTIQRIPFAKWGELRGVERYASPTGTCRRNAASVGRFSRPVHTWPRRLG